MRQAIFFLCLWSCSLLAGHAQEADEANYDESKIPPYTLPALLKTSDGREITTVQQWEQIRRPELLSVFTEQVYGKMPADKVDVSYKKLDDNHSAVNGSATRKQIEITFSHNGIERKALLLMYLPNHVKTKVPVFLHFNFQGNQTVSSDPDIIPSQYSDRPLAGGKDHRRRLRVGHRPLLRLLPRQQGQICGKYSRPLRSSI